MYTKCVHWRRLRADCTLRRWRARSAGDVSRSRRGCSTNRLRITADHGNATPLQNNNPPLTYSGHALVMFKGSDTNWTFIYSCTPKYISEYNVTFIFASCSVERAIQYINLIDSNPPFRCHSGCLRLPVNSLGFPSRVVPSYSIDSRLHYIGD